jgi:2-polyprenyl-3-methyl-5-hydroxy-6-metoxy-1,4-benzoquinol methylase
MNMEVFEEMYRGVPPWDITGPQGEIRYLAETGEIKPPVLDVGCGTGENGLYLAGLGYEVLGIDLVPSAIEKARKKSNDRSITADFLVWDVLKLAELRRNFNSVIDSGLFHTLSDSERPSFVRGLASVLNPGGTYFMLSFNEHEPGSWGPRRVTQKEIKDNFGADWRINYIREIRFDTNIGPECCSAWLSSITLIIRM